MPATALPARVPERQLQDRSPASPRPRSSVPATRPAVHHGDPVAHAEDLGQLGRDHQDRQPAARRGRPSAGGSRPWRRRRRPASARRGSGPPARPPASGRAPPSAGCRRRGCRPASSIDGVLTPSRSHEVGGERRARGGSRAARRVRYRREDGQRRVRGDRHVEDDAVPPAVLGHVGDAERDGRGRASRSRPACRAAGSRPRRPASGRRGRGPARSARRRPGRPGRGSRRRGRVRLTPRDAGRPAAEAAQLQHDVAERHGSPWGRRPTARGRPSCGSARRGRPRPSAACRRPRRRAARSRGRRSAAAPPAGARCRSIPTPCACSSRTTRNRFSTSRSLSEAVGSSRIRTRASAPSARAISTSCCSGIVSVARPRRRGRSSRRRARAAPGAAPRRSPQRIAPPRAARLQAERDVLGDGQVGEQRRLLVDGRDARARGRATGSLSVDRPAVDLERPVVRRDGRR